MRAIVTGGAGGIGQSIARSLARSGYRVALFDSDGDSVGRVAAKIDGAQGIVVDVTDEKSVAAAMQLFDGIPDLLVNNAGITAAGGMTQAFSIFRKIVEVNLFGAFMMCQAVAEAMAARGSGVIINITSAASISSAPTVGAYGPSKAALANLTRAMALQYAPAGVRVNAIAPGFIDAGLGAGPAANPELAKRRLARIPAGTFGEADDVAEVVAFLASDAARYIHGQEIVVDGGVTLTALANTFAS